MLEQGIPNNDGVLTRFAMSEKLSHVNNKYAEAEAPFITSRMELNITSETERPVHRVRLVSLLAFSALGRKCPLTC